MFACLLILLSLIENVHQLEIKASYTTSFQCRNGSYALIDGADLTLVYNYGYSYRELQSFHLYEVTKGRHMFDYESAAGQAFIKDRKNRLKSYEWTYTGIKLTIPNIKKAMDLGKYESQVSTEADHATQYIEIQEIHDINFVERLHEKMALYFDVYTAAIAWVFITCCYCCMGCARAGMGATTAL